ncbi:MAG: hypothetical protein R3Y12_05170 [Clostridia bacterium]
MSAIIPFLVISVASVVGVVFFEKRYEENLHLSMLSIMFMMYCFGISGRLLLGVYVTTGIIIAIYGLALFKVITDGNYKQIIKRTLTPGFFIFVVLYILCLRTNFGMHALTWDEFSHWCDTVKIMYTTDALGIDMAYYPSYPHYPPGVSLLQYLILKLDGSFTEWLIFFTQKIFVLSLGMPFIKKDIKIHEAIITTLILFFGPSMFNWEFYVTTYIDIMLGIVFGFTVAIIALKDLNKFDNLLTVCLSIFALCIIKEAGTIFAILACVLLVIEILRTNMSNLLLTPTIFSLVFPLLSWEIVTSHLTTTSATSGGISLNAIKNFGKTADTAYQNDTITIFINKFTKEALDFGNFEATHFIMLVFIIILGVVLMINGDKKRKIAIKGMIITIVIYILGLLISYLFYFTSYDALRLASFDRYMTIVYAGFSMYAIYQVIYVYEKWYAYVAGLCIVMCFIKQEDTENLWDRVYVQKSTEYRSNLVELVSNFQSVQNDDLYESVLLIEQNTQGLNNRKMKFLLRPDNIIFTYLSSFGEPYSDADIWTSNKTSEEFLSFVQMHYDYIIILSIDEQFINTYSEVFYDPSSLENGAIYKVDNVIERIY